MIPAMNRLKPAPFLSFTSITSYTTYTAYTIFRGSTTFLEGTEIIGWEMGFGDTSTHVPSRVRGDRSLMEV